MVFKAIFGNATNEFVSGTPGLGAVENSKEKILTYVGNGDVLNFRATKPWEKDGNKTLFYYGTYTRNCYFTSSVSEMEIKSNLE